MTREHQESLNERFKEDKINPITGEQRVSRSSYWCVAESSFCFLSTTGVSSEGYKGKGMVSVP